jgi:two-component system, cell cycle response regulator
MRILIAEDDAASHRMLAAALKAAGHEVISAHDGDQALAHLRAADGPSLAILDWQMPGLSGIEVCRRVRAERDGRYRYLMLLTSNTAVEQAAEGIHAGADDYLRKPIDADELNARIHAGERILALEAELVASREAMRREATYDQLTGLLNRGATVAALEREVARAKRGDSALSVLLMDIDSFKAINDTYGHDAGDEILRVAAERMRTTVRGYDFVGRYGGDEFIVVLPGCLLKTATAVAERMRAAIADAPFRVQGIERSASISIGVVEFQPAHTSGTLITEADKSLYQAKRLGRNRVAQSIIDRSLAEASPPKPESSR